MATQHTAASHTVLLCPAPGSEELCNKKNSFGSLLLEGAWVGRLTGVCLVCVGVLSLRG